MTHQDIFDRPEFGTHITQQEHLRRHLRRLILSGKLSPGDRLPAVHALARCWGTTIRTAHLALRTLMREGLLTSVPRVGIYVDTPKASLTRVGIVYSRDVFAPDGSRFIHSIHRQLQILLEKQRVEVSVWVDSRPENQQDTPWETLHTAAVERKIQAIIVPALTWQRMRWMEKLPVCAAYVSTALLPNTVHLNDFQFLDLALKRLASQGCRSVGFLYPNLLNGCHPEMAHEKVSSLAGHFIDRATDMGLKVQNHWMRFQKEDESVLQQTTAYQQAFGYREMHALWNERKRPDGLVIGGDIVMQGVATAILEAGIKVPKALKIVSSKNKYTDLFCPFPISHVVMDEKKIAQALIEQIQIQFRGDRCGVSPKWIDYTLAPQKSKSSRPSKK